jgi:hypothetical protein
MTEITWQKFNTATFYRGETWLRESITNNVSPTSHYLILCSGTLSNTSSLADILAAELSQSYGYTRKLLTFGQGTTYLTNSYQWQSQSVDVLAAGASLQYNNAIVLANAHATANKSVVGMTASNDQIEVTGHGLIVGDRITFTGTGISTPLSTNTLYFVSEVVDINNIKIALTSGGATINLTSDSTGSLICRYANGWEELIGVFPSTETILDGKSHSFIINWRIT